MNRDGSDVFHGILIRNHLSCINDHNYSIQMSFFLIWGNWSFCFWLLHRSFVLSPCFSALISLLHWACTLTSQRLFSRSRALTWSLPFALLQFALFAQSPAPFWSSAHSTMLIWSLVCMLPSAGPISLLFCAHSLAPQRSFAPFVALVHSLRPVRTFSRLLSPYAERICLLARL